MRLIDLEPQFLKLGDGRTYEHVDDYRQADGIRFLCPKCFAANKGAVGTHMVLCWKPGVPADLDPKPGRWNMVGTSYENLSLSNSDRSSSIMLMSGCQWHGYVTNGEVT